MKEKFVPLCKTCAAKGVLSSMSRMPSAVPLHFKGKGFYATDYKDK